MNQINQNKIKISMLAVVAMIICMVGTQQQQSYVLAFKDTFSNPPGYDDGFYMGCDSIGDHSYSYALGFMGTSYFAHQSAYFHNGYVKAFKDCLTYNSHTGQYKFKNWFGGEDMNGNKYDTKHHIYKNYAEMGKALAEALKQN